MNVVSSHNAKRLNVVIMKIVVKIMSVMVDVVLITDVMHVPQMKIVPLVSLVIQDVVELSH